MYISSEVYSELNNYKLLTQEERRQVVYYISDCTENGRYERVKKTFDSAILDPNNRIGLTNGLTHRMNALISSQAEVFSGSPTGQGPDVLEELIRMNSESFENYSLRIGNLN